MNYDTDLGPKFTEMQNQEEERLVYIPREERAGLAAITSLDAMIVALGSLEHMICNSRSVHQIANDVVKEHFKTVLRRDYFLLSETIKQDILNNE